MSDDDTDEEVCESDYNEEVHDNDYDEEVHGSDYDEQVLEADPSWHAEDAELYRYPLPPDHTTPVVEPEEDPPVPLETNDTNSDADDDEAIARGMRELAAVPLPKGRGDWDRLLVSGIRRGRRRQVAHASQDKVRRASVNVTGTTYWYTGDSTNKLEWRVEIGAENADFASHECFVAQTKRRALVEAGFRNNQNH
ncbi:hypothetical protein FPV67DRAFT_1457664 [Lyophyllum atratum]|nr:hypothetical protein FPV67DRAFT_1457664 [Lyophyllum atratum]